MIVQHVSSKPLDWLTKILRAITHLKKFSHANLSEDGITTEHYSLSGGYVSNPLVFQFLYEAGGIVDRLGRLCGCELKDEVSNGLYQNALEGRLVCPRNRTVLLINPNVLDNLATSLTQPDVPELVARWNVRPGQGGRHRAGFRPKLELVPAVWALDVPENRDLLTADQVEIVENNLEPDFDFNIHADAPA